MILTDTLLLMNIVKELYHWDTTIIAGVIGFIGAIIGGILTFIGVKYTLIHQEKNRKLEVLPVKINNSWKIVKQFIFIETLGVMIEKDTNLDDIKFINDFYKNNEDWLTELAASVSAEMYRIVNLYFNHISDYGSWKHRNKQDEWFDRAYQYSNEIAQLIKEYEYEYSKLQ